MSRIRGLLVGFRLGDGIGRELAVAGFKLGGRVGFKLGGRVGLELEDAVGSKLGGFVGFKLGVVVGFKLGGIASSLACRLEARQLATSIFAVGAHVCPPRAYRRRACRTRCTAASHDCLGVGATPTGTARWGRGRVRAFSPYSKHGIRVPLPKARSRSRSPRGTSRPRLISSVTVAVSQRTGSGQ